MLNKVKDGSEAHGKVHLSGEWGVIFGQPAILLGIDKKARARVYPTADKDVVIHATDFGITTQFEDVAQLRKLAVSIDDLWQIGHNSNDFSELAKKINGDKVAFLNYAVGKTLEQLDAETGVYCIFDSAIPVKNGLGSSAALAVSVVSAVSTAMGQDLPANEVNQIAHEVERASHFTPSGGDNACATFGSLYFKEKCFKKVPNLETNLQELALIYTGPRPSTREMVRKMRKEYDLSPSKFDKTFQEIGDIVESEMEAIARGDSQQILKDINRNQELLQEIDVSTPLIDKLHLGAKQLGGALKLSGAGGGGYAIAYHPNKDKQQEIVNLAERLGCSAEIIQIK
jgi:mevalonate kinase